MAGWCGFDAVAAAADALQHALPAFAREEKRRGIVVGGEAVPAEVRLHGPDGHRTLGAGEVVVQRLDLVSDVDIGAELARERHRDAVEAELQRAAVVHGQGVEDRADGLRRFSRRARVRTRSSRRSFSQAARASISVARQAAASMTVIVAVLPAGCGARITGSEGMAPSRLFSKVTEKIR